MLQVCSSGSVFNQLGSDLSGDTAEDQSGFSVSLSKDGLTVAIGAPFNSENGSNSGHVKIFRMVANGWTQLGENINGDFEDDYSGHSVSLSGDGLSVAIGSPNKDGAELAFAASGGRAGNVRVFKFDADNDTWIQRGENVNGEMLGDSAGWSVSMSFNGLTVAIGAIFNSESRDKSGHVRVFTFDEADNSWNQLGGDFDGEGAKELSGWSVSLSRDGRTIAIGAPFNNDEQKPNQGHVQVFHFNDAKRWVQLGDDINGEVKNDRSGRSVSLSADGLIVAIGSIFNSDNGLRSGHVRIFEYDGNGWTQLGVNINGDLAGDEAGHSVSLSDNGHVIAIGAPFNDGNSRSVLSNKGHTKVFRFDSFDNEWIRVGEVVGEKSGDWSGKSVSISSDGRTVAVGAATHDGVNGKVSGMLEFLGYAYRLWHLLLLQYNLWNQRHPQFLCLKLMVKRLPSVILL